MVVSFYKEHMYAGKICNGNPIPTCYRFHQKSPFLFLKHPFWGFWNHFSLFCIFQRFFYKGIATPVQASLGPSQVEGSQSLCNHWKYNTKLKPRSYKELFKPCNASMSQKMSRNIKIQLLVN